MKQWLLALLIGQLAHAAGLPSKCIPSVAPANAIHLDAAWFTAHRAPWLLDAKNGYYILDVDAFASGTAFVASEAGVTLDLNCHRVVYGNGTPPALPTWRGNETDPIAIPEAGIEYAAVITPKGPSAAVLTLSVVDAATRAPIASAKAASVGRGFSAVAQFVAKTTAPVRLCVEITGPGPVTLDVGTLARSREYGVVATPSVWNLPEPLKSDTRVATFGRRVKNFHLRNGRLQQGQGRAYGGAGLQANWADGIALDKIGIHVKGDDANPVDAIGSGSFQIVDSTVEAQTKRITNRMTIFAGVNLARAHGTIVVERTRFERLPQCGVMIARQRAADAPVGEAQSVRIVDNVFRLAALVSDPYAILLVGIQHFLVAGNLARPTNGRGLLLDGWGDAAIEDGEIRDNVFEAYEKPNLEYGAALEATALRIRNWANKGVVAPDKGAVRRVNIHDNQFIARTDAAGVTAAIAARVSFRNDDGRMNRAGNSISHNLFRAVSTKAEYPAYALSFSGVYAGVETRYESNTYETSGTAIRLGDSDSYRDREEDITLTGGTVAATARHLYEKQSVNTVRDIRFVGVKTDKGEPLPEFP